MIFCADFSYEFRFSRMGMLPEFTTEIQRYFTDGDTYEEALSNAQEVLELLIESYQAEGKPLPQPQTLQVA